jgi:hypothetical protein
MIFARSQQPFLRLLLRVQSVAKFAKRYMFFTEYRFPRNKTFPRRIKFPRFIVERLNFQNENDAMDAMKCNAMKWNSPIGSFPFHRAQKTREFQGPAPSHFPT